MLYININNKYDFELNNTQGTLLVNNKPVNIDISSINDTNWHVINNFKTYNVELISFSKEEKIGCFKINGNLYHINAKDGFDILLDKLGINYANTTKLTEVKAPMPGMVLHVFVTDGMEVKKGDNLFTLEAMKMENIIKSTTDMVVKSVKIKPGDKVEKNQVLISI